MPLLYVAVKHVLSVDSLVTRKPQSHHLPLIIRLLQPTIIYVAHRYRRHLPTSLELHKPHPFLQHHVPASTLVLYHTTASPQSRPQTRETAPTPWFRLLPIPTPIPSHILR
jgi:hypothetical protein